MSPQPRILQPDDALEPLGERPDGAPATEAAAVDGFGAASEPLSASASGSTPAARLHAVFARLEAVGDWLEAGEPAAPPAYPRPAPTRPAVQVLEARLAEVEGRLDALVSALERAPAAAHPTSDLSPANPDVHHAPYWDSLAFDEDAEADAGEPAFTPRAQDPEADAELERFLDGLG